MTPLGRALAFTSPIVFVASLVALSGLVKSPEPLPAAAPSVEMPRWLAPEDVEAPKMGTRVRFVAYPRSEDDRTRLREVLGAALRRIDELAAKLSSYDEASVPSRINAARGAFVEIDEDTRTILEKALSTGRESGGAFDITHQTLAHLWPFGSDKRANQTPPPPHAVKRALELVGLDRVVLEGSRAKVSDGTKIGLDGIAKGYILDEAVEVIRKAGFESFLAQAGGDLYAAGTRPDGSAWRSGIRDPRGADGAFFARVELRDRAFSTAGDYARSFVHDGRRYHHILDTKTGYPSTKCRSVTVLARDAFTADALDDAIFVLGPELGLELLEKYPGTEAVIVDAENRVTVSPGLVSTLEVLREPTNGL